MRRLNHHSPSMAGRQVRCFLLMLVIIASSWHMGSPVTAQPSSPVATSGDCVVSTEPDDQPDSATELAAGDACATADNPNAGQHLYRWEVTDAEAATRWTLALSAIPGQIGLLEIYALDIDDGGTIRAVTKLAASRGSASAPVQLANLLFRTGTYYVAVATSGPGPYQLSITEGDPIPPASTSEPATVTGQLAVSGTWVDVPNTISWTIDDTSSHLDLRVQAPVGAALDWELADDTGALLYRTTVGIDGIALLPDLGLAEGVYTLSLRSTDGVPTPWIVTTTATTPRSPQSEDEPNESSQYAMPIAFDGDHATIGGRLATTPSETDTDSYRITIDETLAGRLIDFRLLWQGGSERTLCLYDSTDAELRCAKDVVGASLNDFVLPVGEYTVRISGLAAPGDPYVLKIDVTGEAVDGFEAEPNNSMERANPLAA